VNSLLAPRDPGGLAGLNAALDRAQADLNAQQHDGNWTPPAALTRTQRERINADFGDLLERASPGGGALRGTEDGMTGTREPADGGEPAAPRVPARRGAGVGAVGAAARRRRGPDRRRLGRLGPPRRAPAPVDFHGPHQAGITQAVVPSTVFLSFDVTARRPAGAHRTAAGRHRPGPVPDRGRHPGGARHHDSPSDTAPSARGSPRTA